MRIAMITPGLLPVPAVKGGAVEVLIEYLIEGNENLKQHNIDLYTIANEEIRNCEYKYTNIIPVDIRKKTQIINKLTNMIYNIFGIKKWRTSFGRELVKLLNSQVYDMIIIHNNLMAYRDIYEKTNNKNNLVYVAHNDVNDGDENHLIIAKLIGRTASQILAVSEYTMNNFKEICENAKIDVLYNCIDLEKYSHRITSQERECLRNKYGISEKDFVFIYSGRIDIYKGVLELIQAFKKLEQKNTKLLIVGASWFDNENIKDEYAHKLYDESEMVKENIVFTGFIRPDEMPIMYQIADCLVVPSIWEEPFGVVALEGMASKLPLIVTNSGGLVEIVDEKCAFVVDKNKNLVKELSATMEKVSKDSIRAKEVAYLGYKKVYSVPEYDKENYYKVFCRKIEK